MQCRGLRLTKLAVPSSAFSASVSVETRSLWVLAKASCLVDRLLGGQGAQDDVARVVARWEGCFHLTTMGGILVYTAPPQHCCAQVVESLVVGLKLMQLSAAAQWWFSGGVQRLSQIPLELCRQSAGGKIGIVSSSWLVALCRQLL